jgi:hypothetical protein
VRPGIYSFLRGIFVRPYSCHFVLRIVLEVGRSWNPLFLKPHCNSEFADRDCPALIEVGGFLPYNRRSGFARFNL